MKRCLALLLTVACVSCGATRHIATPALVVSSCSAADLWTTKRGFDRGAVEANSITGMSDTQRLGPLVAEKTAATGVILAGMWYLQTHGHERWARGLGYFAGSVWCGAAAYNETVH